MARSVITRFLQGRFLNHPLHPILVHFPIGLWVTSFIFDVLFVAKAGQVFVTVSFYMMLAGIVGAFLAVPTGIAEWIQIPKNTLPRRIAMVHMLLSGTVTGLYIFNLVSRWVPGQGPQPVITPGELVLSLLSLLILSATGYLGGLLVYNYGIGFKPQLRDEDEDHHEHDEEIRRTA